jgi:GT2 family glycosyltransferase
MQQPYVVTIILNTNRRQDTLECLASLARSSYPKHKVIVLDNASCDGSVDAIRAAFPEVQIFPLTDNLGYAGNNNVGIEVALKERADWIFILNEDTVVAPDCLTFMIETGESDPQVGIVGPMVYHHNEPNIIQSAGGRMDRAWNAWHLGQNEWDRGQFNQLHQVDWISGCAILVRRSVIEKIGSLDERFFYYWEETEWCLRAREQGWRIVHVPQAKLWHKGVQRDYRPGPSVTYYSTRNRLLMMSKHQASLTAWISVWLQLLRTLISWTARPKWKSMRSHRNAMLRGIRDFLRRKWGRGNVQ